METWSASLWWKPERASSNSLLRMRFTVRGGLFLFCRGAVRCPQIVHKGFTTAAVRL